MGYSSRYHIASLTAVFVALAVGILIGSEIGGDVINSTRENLEESLTGDLDRARAQNEELRRELEWSRDFGAAATAPLVAERLSDRRYAVVGFGSLPESVIGPVEKIFVEADATLAGVGVVREPPSLDALSGKLEGTVFLKPGGSGVRLRAYGRAVGRQLVLDGLLFRRTRAELMSSSSGSFGPLDGVVIYRGPQLKGDPDDPSQRQTSALTDSMIQGMISTRAALVGVETIDDERSSVSFFEARLIPSVDSIELESGQLSLVYVLDGAQGKFGVKEGADSFLPRIAQSRGSGND